MHFRMSFQVLFMRVGSFTLVAFVELPYTIVCDHMRSKLAWSIGGIFALFTFVGLLCTVSFNMSVQIWRERIGFFTLVAFVERFLTTVSFIMHPQITHRSGGIFTLTTFVRLFSTMDSNMYPQITWCCWGIWTVAASKGFLSTVFLHVSSGWWVQKKNIHTGYIVETSLYVFLYVSLDLLGRSIVFHTGRIYGTSFQHCAFSLYVSLDGLIGRRYIHRDCMCETSFHCGYLESSWVDVLLFLSGVFLLALLVSN